MPIIGKHRKLILSPDEIKFIQDNWNTNSNSELAAALGLKITKLRAFLAEMGLKRMELEYWTIEQTEWLKTNFQYYGDVEIAEIFNQLYKKNKGWTKKHIEKKRLYLKLNRTPDELESIFQRNKIQGRFKMCPVKRWEYYGTAEIGHVFWWRINGSDKKYPVIKTENGYFHYYRYIYTQKYGKLKSDQYVVPKINSPTETLLSLENLEVIDRIEHQKRNVDKRMEYPEELRIVMRAYNKLKKQLKINEDGKQLTNTQ